MAVAVDVDVVLCDMMLVVLEPNKNVVVKPWMAD
jgi:hypothetical protein